MTLEEATIIYLYTEDPLNSHHIINELGYCKCCGKKEADIDAIKKLYRKAKSIVLNQE